MGSQLVAGVLAIKAETAPNWDDARAHIAAMSDIELLYLGDNYSDMSVFNVMGDNEVLDPPEEIREALLNILQEVEAGWNGMDRRFCWMNYKPLGVDLFITGEMTWGEDPSGHKMFTILEEAGVAKAAGFIVEDQEG